MSLPSHVVLKSDGASGRAYYYNSKTGVSAWAVDGALDGADPTAKRPKPGAVSGRKAGAATGGRPAAKVRMEDPKVQAMVKRAMEVVQRSRQYQRKRHEDDRKKRQPRDEPAAAPPDAAQQETEAAAPPQAAADAAAAASAAVLVVLPPSPPPPFAGGSAGGDTESSQQ
jgi:hypothetical protein